MHYTVPTVSTRGRQRHDAAFWEYIRYALMNIIRLRLRGCRCVVTLLRNGRKHGYSETGAMSTRLATDVIDCLMVSSHINADRQRRASPAASHGNSITSRIRTCRRILHQTSSGTHRSLCTAVYYFVSKLEC